MTTLHEVVRDELHEDVQRLIADHITSVEQLEVLLLLRGDPGLEWSARRVSEELRTSERSSAARLADLRQRGFLAAREEDGATLYRFRPATEWMEGATGQLAAAYAERHYTVIDLIFSRPIDRLHVYADAFRFRKDDPDG